MDSGRRAAVGADAGDAPAAARSTDEYREIFLAERARLRRIAYLLGCPADRLDDVVADAFVRTFEPWRSGTVRDVGAYLRRAVVNEVRDGSRRERSRLRWSARQASVPPLVDGSDAALADQDRVVAALRLLPAEQRVVLVLRFAEDLSEEQTADALGLAVGTVKSRTARALAQLRRQLGEDDDG